ncbi:universal stress protein [Rhodococcus sp. G-MC3]|uniref:universal stress protein n=1 Tax=Rhodococcus sp. G-MC3 TaxID=3046209 RepID=UPI0024BBB051|nr:universal stress protein [Rhodococcus sp. G-MC3]MDJ0396479.1 universal stress protein [Rhodococcus sp. G-MC3]
MMGRSQRVVVGVDGSSNSLGATRWAAAVASRMRVPLHLQCGVERPLCVDRSFDLAPDFDWGEHLCAASRTIVDNAKNIALEAYPNITVSTEVTGGFIARALLESSDHASMLVVGQSGLASVGSALVGSTTQLVVDQAGCPVVVWKGDRVSGPGNAPVVVGVDGSELSSRAVEKAFRFAAMFDAPLIAVHSWSSALTAGISKFRPRFDQGGTEAAEDAVLAEGVAGSSEEFPEVSVQRVLREGSPTEELLAVSESSQLIVVGSRGHTGLFGAIAGSTSRNLLYHANVPVMICRPPRH